MATDTISDTVTLTITYEHPDTHILTTHALKAPYKALLCSFLDLSGHKLDTPCGGKRLCGKCRVIATGALSCPEYDELQALSAQELAQGVRLACCTQLLGDAAVILPCKTQLKAIVGGGVMPKFEYEPLFKSYGAAIDIGTTTLAAQLYGVNGLIASATALNPQSGFGADVITRIGHALHGKSEELANAVTTAIASLLQDIQQQAGLAPQSIDALVITGNTAMLYLFTQQNPDCLSHSPFEADELFGRFILADALALPCAKGAQIYLPKCISAFVGADITTALLASELCEYEGTALLVDIGTNGEMALWHEGKLMCCSTAAGPAFEGAGLSHGMQGARGAIDHVKYDAETSLLQVHTIEDAIAIGICGSGVIDAIASLVKTDIIEESGLLVHDGQLLKQLMCKIKGEKGEENAVELAKNVALTQGDIRMVQLAKSAVCAGIHTLLHTARVSAQSVEGFAIAGGFGSYLNLENAAQIGLFPSDLLPKAAVLGNAALSGAAMLLLNRKFLAKSQAIASDAQIVDLSESPVFLEHYMECMLF